MGDVVNYSACKSTVYRTFSNIVQVEKVSFTKKTQLYSPQRLKFWYANLIVQPEVIHMSSLISADLALSCKDLQVITT